MHKCPHCKRQLHRIFQVKTMSNVLYYKQEKGCYYWAKDKDEIEPKGITFTSEEMINRFGGSPEFESSTYLCPRCLYILPSDMVEMNMCQWKDVFPKPDSED